MTTKAAHTPEPWRVSKYDQHRVTSGSHDIAMDDQICSMIVIPRGQIVDADIDRQRTADARRIVACVNACVRIPTDNLERNADVIRQIDNMRLADIKAQRDALAAALRELMEAVEEPDADSLMALVHARAALAKLD